MAGVAALSREPHELASDLDLCASSRAGCQSAFSTLAVRYQRPLRAFCARLVGNDQAEDVVQQSLVSAWVALADRQVEVDQPKAWLYRIARNQAMDWLRSAGSAWGELDPNWQAPDTTEHAVESRDRLGRLSAGMKDLPARQREALVMHAMAGHSYGDIAAVMDTNVPAVSQLINRARTRLRAAIAALLPPPLIARFHARAARASSPGPVGRAAVLVSVASACAIGSVVTNGPPSNHPRASTPSAPAASSASAASVAAAASRHSVKPQ